MIKLFDRRMGVLSVLVSVVVGAAPSLAAEPTTTTPATTATTKTTSPFGAFGPFDAGLARPVMRQ